MRHSLTLPPTLPRLCFASFALIALCSCSWQKYLPAADGPTLPNAVAIDRALHHCALTQGEEPFHLVLSVASPERATNDMSAQVELSWLNPLTYRIAIHSRDFNQIRIANSGVVEEHNDGAYYPRWIQNFVDALLDPIPNLATLRTIPGDIPIGPAAHPCISTADADPAKPSGAVAPEPDPTRMARICFQGADLRIASTLSFSRSIWFDDFSPFGSQQVPRTLVNALPSNIQPRGHIIRLEPLSFAEQPLLKAHESTPPLARILTTLVPESTARSLLLNPPAASLPIPDGPNSISIYIRTDRTGKVREAYRANSDNGAALYSAEDPAVIRALTFRFKPLLLNGIPVQMEAPLRISSKSTPH